MGGMLKFIKYNDGKILHQDVAFSGASCTGRTGAPRAWLLSTPSWLTSHSHLHWRADDSHRFAESLAAQKVLRAFHASTLGTTLGTGSIALASMICFSALQTRLALHEIVIRVLVTITAPVTLMVLVRAARFRDRVERAQEYDVKAPQGFAFRMISLF